MASARSCHTVIRAVPDRAPDLNHANTACDDRSHPLCRAWKRSPTLPSVERYIWSRQGALPQTTRDRGRVRRPDRRADGAFKGKPFDETTAPRCLTPPQHRRSQAIVFASPNVLHACMPKPGEFAGRKCSRITHCCRWSGLFHAEQLAASLSRRPPHEHQRVVPVQKHRS